MKRLLTILLIVFSLASCGQVPGIGGMQHSNSIEPGADPLILVGTANYTGQYLVYSTDHGVTWNKIEDGLFGSGGIYSIAYNGNIFVGGGFTGNTLGYSYDGITWTGLGTSIFDNYVNSFLWDGVKWIACGRLGAPNTRASSLDGVNWTGAGTSVFQAGMHGVDYDGLSTYIAVGYSTHKLAHSNDGVTLTGLGSTIFSTSGWAVEYNGGLWVIGGEGTNTMAYCNGDPTVAGNWVGLGTGICSTRCLKVRSNSAGTMWVAGGVGTNNLAYSSDGMNWTPIASDMTTVSDIFYSQSSGKFYIVGYGSYNFGVSSDGINWTFSNTIVSQTNRAIYVSD